MSDLVAVLNNDGLAGTVLLALEGEGLVVHLGDLPVAALVGVGRSDGGVEGELVLVVVLGADGGGDVVGLHDGAVVPPSHTETGELVGVLLESLAPLALVAPGVLVLGAFVESVAFGDLVCRAGVGEDDADEEEDDANDTGDDEME